ncbi:MAG: hypothetical protein ACR2OC_03305 [Solirubrobacterales bacterium]
MRNRTATDPPILTLPAPAALASSALLPPLVVALCVSLFGPQEFAWLWIGSQVEGATQSLGAGLAVAFIGSVISIILTAWVARRLDAVWLAVRRGAGGSPSLGLFEPAMVLGTALVVIALVIWLFFIEGTGPSIAPNVQ